MVWLSPFSMLTPHATFAGPVLPVTRLVIPLIARRAALPMA